MLNNKNIKGDNSRICEEKCVEEIIEKRWKYK